MNVFAKILKFIFAPQTLVVLLIAGVVGVLLGFGRRIPFYGHLPSLVRLLIIIVLIAIALAVIVAAALRKKKGAEETELSMIQEADAAVASAADDERRARESARQELVAAIAALKKSKLAGGQSGGAALYVLPWYMVLGSGASGKSSLIRNSGLRVPGRAPGEIKGIGASPHCEWWLTNQAVVLEANRRFADPGKDKAAERDWTTFLDQLRKHRPQTPLNGVVITLSAEDLLRSSADEIEARVQHLRRRLDDLVSRLHLVFPLYLVITKTDLVHGFGEFFGDLHGAAREQIWGATLPGALMSQAAPEKVFDQEFQLLFRTLLKRRMPRLVREEDPQQLGGIYLFPLELWALRDRLRRCVQALCGPAEYGHGALLRGFYFTSGGGEARGGEARPFFLSNLFLNVLVPDYEIARPTTGAAQRHWHLQLAIGGAAVLVMLLLGIWAGASFSGNRRFLRETAEIVRPVQPAPLRERSAAMLQQRLAELEPLRARLDLLDRYDSPVPPARLGLGLYQGGRLYDKGRGVYLRALTQALILPSRERIRNWLREHPPADPNEYLQWRAKYEDYVQISEKARADTSALALELADIWTQGRYGAARSYAPAGGPGALKAAIQRHLAFAYRDAGALESVWQANGYELADLRELSERYRGMQGVTSGDRIVDQANRAVGDFTIGSVPDARLMLVAAGDARVPGAYTVAGWRWIRDYLGLGDRKGGAGGGALSGEDRPDPATFVERYSRDYVRAWEGFLTSVDVSTQGGMQETAGRLRALAKDGSPFFGLLDKAGENLSFQDELGSGEQKDLAPLLGIDRAFTALHEFRRDKGLEGYRKSDYQKRLLKVAEDLDKMLDASDRSRKAAEFAQGVFKDPDSDASGMKDALLAVKKFCSDQSGGGGETLQTLLQRPPQAAWVVCLEETRGYYDRAWQAEVLKPFQEKLADKYPLDPRSTIDAPLPDFGRFFGQGGVLAAFEGKLADFREQDGSLKVVRGGSLPLSQPMRDALDKAAQIRRALGLEQSVSPRVDFKIEPAQVQADRSKLSVGDTKIDYDNGMPRPTDFQWPDKSGRVWGRVAVRVQGSGVEPECKTARDSEWALFLLLDRADSVEQLPDGRSYRFVWKIEAPKGPVMVPFVVRAGSSDNPFARGFLKYALPARLGE